MNKLFIGISIILAGVILSFTTPKNAAAKTTPVYNDTIPNKKDTMLKWPGPDTLKHYPPRRPYKPFPDTPPSHRRIMN